MVNEGRGVMDTDNDKKKIDDLVEHRKRSDSDAAQYAARLKTYVTLKQKRQRAAIARRHVEHADRNEKRTNSKNRLENCGENPDDLDENGRRMRSRSRSVPSDKCGPRRRRRRCSSRARKRRRRSCGCRRRRSRVRRRRRSRSRRRRRRSCGRRRMRRRRCR